MASLLDDRPDNLDDIPTSGSTVDFIVRIDPDGFGGAAAANTDLRCQSANPAATGQTTSTCASNLDVADPCIDVNVGDLISLLADTTADTGNGNDNFNFTAVFNGCVCCDGDPPAPVDVGGTPTCVRPTPTPAP